MASQTALLRLSQKPEHRLLLSVLSGLMLGASWYPPFSLLSFLALVPLLAIGRSLDGVKRGGIKLFAYAFLAF